MLVTSGRSPPHPNDLGIAGSVPMELEQACQRRDQVARRKRPGDKPGLLSLSVPSALEILMIF